MIFYQTPQITVQWDDELKAVHNEWRGFIYGDDYKLALNKILELLIQKKADRMFSDTRKLRVLNQDDQKWAGTDWIPRVRDAGLKYQAIIIPSSQLANMAVRNTINKATLTGSTETQYFDDVEKAREWMRSL